MPSEQNDNRKIGDGADPVYRAPAAAAYVGESESTLAKRRMRGDGPAFLKLGKRTVGYRRSDLDAWLAACRRTSTSDQGRAA